MKIALFLARFAAKGRNPEKLYGNRATVIATNLIRKAGRKAK